MIPFEEERFSEAAETILKPWLRDHVDGGTFDSFDGKKIQYYRALSPDAKAVIVMVHGFCEFFGKFHETAYNFWENGYTVYFIEQRGHGGSGNPEAPDVVDVGDFTEYVEDLKCLLDKVVLPETSGLRLRSGLRTQRNPEGGQRESKDPEGRELSETAAGTGPCAGKKNLILYAHSMGGCVSALFLERHPEYFLAAVLSSPMLKMTFGSIPAWQVEKLLAPVSKALGWNEKLMPGMQRFDPEKADFEGSGTSSQARFDYQFALRTDPLSQGIYTMNAGTFRWGRAAMKAAKEVREEAGRVTIPVLLCQAGKDEYVDNEGQNEFARKAKHVKLVHFPESKHEIYASDPESMKKYYRELLLFFEKAQTL